MQRWLVGAGCAALLLTVIVRLASTSDHGSVGAPPPKHFGPMLQLEGVSNSAYDRGGHLVRTLRLRQLSLRPRRFGLFNVNSIYEWVGRNADVDVQIPVKGRLEILGIRDMVAALVPVPRRYLQPRKTPITIDAITIRFHRDSTTVLTLTARSGRVEHADRVEFKNAVLVDAERGRSLETSDLIWDASRRTFFAPGAFRSVNRGVSHFGQRSEFDLALSPSV